MSARLVLEMVPPLLSSGDNGLSRNLDYIRRVADALQLEAINIPEIHTERQRMGASGQLTPCDARVPTREFAAMITDACGVDCIVNHVVVYDSIEQLEEWLQQSRQQFGIRQFVLVGGESSAITCPGPNVSRANRLARQLFSPADVRIGNICIPSRDQEANRIRAKIDAGADFFSTQIIYDLQELLTFSQRLLAAGVDTNATQFYLSFCPVSSLRNIRFLERLGVTLPEPIHDWLLTDPQIMLERSKTHIAEIWQRFQQHTRQRQVPMPVNINLSPIGHIAIADAIDLGKRLLLQYRTED